MADTKTFNIIQVSDQSLMLIQSNIQAALSFPSTALTMALTNGVPAIQNSLTKTENAPFLSGNVITTPLVSGKDNFISHGLGRTPLNWTLMSIDQNSNVWQVATKTLASLSNTNVAQARNSTYINLWCSTSCNIQLWVN